MSDTDCNLQNDARLIGRVGGSETEAGLAKGTRRNFSNGGG